ACFAGASYVDPTEDIPVREMHRLVGTPTPPVRQDPVLRSRAFAVYADPRVSCPSVTLERIAQD
ncbi:hypothetical protein LPJ81_006500, partial [Coemansia sp. IMI 209127]